MKPFLFVYNTNNIEQKLSENLEKRDSLKLDIKIEEELMEMEPEEDDETTPYEMALEYFDYNVRGVKGDGAPIWCDDDFE
jgi:hypothetical protein